MTAKIFWSGNSQAVRLPKEFRFETGTEEVAIRREGEQIILERFEIEDADEPRTVNIDAAHDALQAWMDCMAD